MTRLFTLLRSEERGVAVIEFAMLSLFFFVIVSVALDFAMYINYRQRLGTAVEQGGVIAFNSRKASSIDLAAITNYVKATSDLPGDGATVTLRCNGDNSCATDMTANDLQCACWNADHGAFDVLTPCDGTCAAGGAPGYYMTVRASYDYTSMIVPDRWLDGRNMKQSVTVKLQ